MHLLCKLIHNYFTLWPFKFVHHEIKFRETHNKWSDCEYKFRDATFKVLYDTNCILNIDAWKKLLDLNASIFKIKSPSVFYCFTFHQKKQFRYSKRG